MNISGACLVDGSDTEVILSQQQLDRSKTYRKWNQTTTAGIGTRHE